MKAIKYELKIIHKKEVVVGAENRQAAEEILQTMIATGQEFNVSNAEPAGCFSGEKGRVYLPRSV